MPFTSRATNVQREALEEARDALLDIGDTQTAAEAEAFLARAAGIAGGATTSSTPPRCRKRLVADAGASVAKARVLCLSARLHMLSSEEEEAIRIGTEALVLAEELELDELRIHALTSIGTAKAWLDHTGHEELDLALEIANARTNSPLAVTVLNNLGVLAARMGTSLVRRSSDVETLRTAERMGDGENIRFSRGNLLYNSTVPRPLGRDHRERRPLHRRVRDLAAQHGGVRAGDARDDTPGTRRRRGRTRRLGPRTRAGSRAKGSGTLARAPQPRPRARIHRA